jgi:uncharacterized membrane protein
MALRKQEKQTSQKVESKDSNTDADSDEVQGKQDVKDTQSLKFNPKNMQFQADFRGRYGVMLMAALLIIGILLSLAVTFFALKSLLNGVDLGIAGAKVWAIAGIVLSSVFIWLGVSR